MIMNSLKEREQSIADALNAAKKAKEEMSALKDDSEILLRQARAERDLMLKEAREAKDEIIAEAKLKAQTEGSKIIAQAQEVINNQKMAAITELKNSVATMSIEIAEKILRQELSRDEKQRSLMQNLMDDINLN
jgi:F-type H+-transporting ATPase subunit b